MGKHRKIKPGDLFKNLEVIENLGYQKYCGENITYWKCKCLKCGKIINVPQKNLGTAQNDCGCWRNEARKPIEAGEKFGRLTVLGRRKLIPGRGYEYFCECSCDKHTRLYVRGDLLRSGETKSCGCIHDELFEKNNDKGNSTRFQGTCVSVLCETIQKNNSSGATGVSWHKGTGKWYARIQFKGQKYSLGYYSDKNNAIKVRKAAEEELHGDFKSWYAENYPEKWEKLLKKNKKSD